MSKAHDVLKSTFGYDCFRGSQAEIIDCIIDGSDAVVLMPTGGGKSFCYQIPALIRSGTAIIISPLIALMKDQVGALLQAGVRATYINSSLPANVARQYEDEMVAGHFDLVYVAPERLMSERFLKLLDETELALFAIDEAHCVSQWGHDFRPEYLQLAELGERFSGVPRMALTATADVPTRRDILERLKLDSARLFISGFDRPNICYRVMLKDGPRRQLLRFLRNEHPRDSGIVYCLTRKRVEQTAAWLADEGFSALPYHAGLDSRTRDQNQQRFIHDEGLIVVATVAFGLGIDKPDVRFVAHLDPPRSLEAYYQETGRAGRDGLPSDAWMTYSLADIVAQAKLIEGNDAPDEQKRIERQRLNVLHGYCETTDCRRRVLLKHFGQSLESPCGNCDTCLEPVETWSATVEAQKLMSCVYRTGQRFGAGHVVDVLLGKETEKVNRLQHQQLSTYGIGKELSPAGWHSVARQLVAMGLLDVDYQYGSIRLTESAWPVLKGAQELHLRRDPAADPAARKTKKAPRRPKEKITLQTAEDKALFEALRAKRRELANAQAVPPYMVFPDTTLLEFALHKPHDLPSMALINGVGEAKLSKYGQTFLEVVNGHRPANAD